MKRVEGKVCTHRERRRCGGISNGQHGEEECTFMSVYTESEKMHTVAYTDWQHSKA